MFRFACTLLVTATLAGCGATGDRMFPARGLVTYADGQPVTGEMATVVFVPDNESSNPAAGSASGTIESDGSFELMTHQPSDGALPGDYRVVLKVWSNYRQQTAAVPATYSEPSTTPLRATVGPESTEFRFAVDR